MRSQPILLLISANPDIVSAIDKRASQAGFLVLVAEYWEDIRLAASRTPPATILLDVAKSLQNPGETLRRICSDQVAAGIPVAVVSTGCMGQHEALKMGASGYLHKPYDPRDLLSLLRRMGSTRRTVRRPLPPETSIRNRLRVVNESLQTLSEALTALEHSPTKERSIPLRRTTVGRIEASYAGHS